MTGCVLIVDHERWGTGTCLCRWFHSLGREKHRKSLTMTYSVPNLFVPSGRLFRSCQIGWCKLNTIMNTFPPDTEVENVISFSSITTLTHYIFEDGFNQVHCLETTKCYCARDFKPTPQSFLGKNGNKFCNSSISNSSLQEMKRKRHTHFWPAEDSVVLHWLSHKPESSKWKNSNKTFGDDMICNHMWETIPLTKNCRFWHLFESKDCYHSTLTPMNTILYSCLLLH